MQADFFVVSFAKHDVNQEGGVTMLAPVSARELCKGVLCLMVLSALPSARAQFVRNESTVALERDLLDPEYSNARAQVTWIDSNGNLWVANVDRHTGLFEPADGKGTLVDTNAMRTSDFRKITNGPEWIGTAHGDQVVYTRFDPGQIHNLVNARLGVAWQSDKSAWSLRTLSPNLPRSTPYASLNEGDPAPILTYLDPQGNHYWRDLYDASTETRITQSPPSLMFSVRIAEGPRAVAFTQRVAGVQQVFIDWLDTNDVQQITFDDGQKDLHSRPFVWKAPDYGGDLVMETVVDDTELRIYHLPPNGSNTDWKLVASIRTPDDGVINSPEHFEYNGKSYVFFVANVPPLVNPSAVFLAGIAAGNPIPRQLTPNQPQRQRTDPEVFITDGGPYIYYNRGSLAPGQDFCLTCNEGIFRTYTGLAPKQ
ncbi:MAG: hypothetical protein JSS21_07600 [Proteobacteria bacterium]|nr:hypothetical protein [Pseudomonadota bacterium]